MADIVNQNNKLAPTGVKGISNFLNSDAVKAKFADILGQKANGFIASVLSVINSNGQLAKADQNSIYTSALLAASLELPINPSLGFAYIVSYNTKQADGSFKVMAQFQLGYKGFKQLALRSGQFKELNETDVREGEIKKRDRLTGHIEFTWIEDSKVREKTPVIGYVSFFELINGFKSTYYMTVEEIEAHAKKYSQTYKKYGTGLWKDEKDGMSMKTVCKLNLSKNAPLSIEMQRAVIADQAVIKNFDPTSNEETLEVEVEYVDNNETIEEKIEDQKAEIKGKQQTGEQSKIDMA